MPSPNSPVTSHESRVTSFKSSSFTLLSKNASANHLVSHSCKNKGLKVPCFHTLTKKGVGRGPGHRCPARKRGVLSNLQPHTSNLRPPLSDHPTRMVVPSERSEPRDLSLPLS